MKNLNECHLIGRAGKDAEIKTTSGGKTLTTFSLATGGGKKKDGSGDYPADWHRCIAWGEELGAIAGQITKGSLVEVYGRISYGSYEKEGRKVYTTDIVCTRVLDPDGDNLHEAPVRQLRNESPEITDEDIPF